MRRGPAGHRRAAAGAAGHLISCWVRRGFQSLCLLGELPVQLPLPLGEGRGRSGGFGRHAASPRSDSGLRAGMRTASEGLGRRRVACTARGDRSACGAPHPCPAPRFALPGGEGKIQALFLYRKPGTSVLGNKSAERSLPRSPAGLERGRVRVGVGVGWRRAPSPAVRDPACKPDPLSGLVACDSNDPLRPLPSPTRGRGSKAPVSRRSIARPYHRYLAMNPRSIRSFHHQTQRPSADQLPHEAMA